MEAPKGEPGALLVAKYRLEHVLGQGGMGVVWAAARLDGGEQVAIKLLKAGLNDPDARRRLIREAGAARRVSHSNIVKIIDVLELEDGDPAIVMERLDGETLEDRLRRERRIGLRELANLLVPVISAIGTAHAAGVVHRDLKPANIFLFRNGAGETSPKVLDFGIAMQVTLDSETMHSTGITTAAVLGTPTYMAPEQVFGEHLDHRADVWALGIMLYRCLSGVLPTIAGNVGQVFKNVLGREFEPLEELVADVPKDVAQLVARMLVRDRDRRQADLREVLSVIGRHATVTAPGFDQPPALRATAPLAPRPEARPRIVGTYRPRPTVLVVGGVAMASAVLWFTSLRPGGSERARSPLADPAATLACPILHVSGVNEPAGWLGAAAAATACERARVLLGGRPERTFVPAELLGLERQPVDRFVDDPFGRPNARERTHAEAKSRAAAYFDGSVIARGTEISVVLELHRSDGTELARGKGSARGLYAAVRAAMDPLVGPALLPAAAVLDPSIAAWSGARQVEPALALVDLTFAIAHNAGDLAAECERFERTSSASLGSLGRFGLWQCAYSLGRPASEVILERNDTSPAAVATWIRLHHLLTHQDDPKDADFLHQLWESDSTSWGKSLAAVTESCIVQSTDPKRAQDMALAAVQAEPKNFDGQSCNPWGQLLTLYDGTNSARSAARAMQAWMPWSDISWFAGSRAAENADEALIALHRAYLLAPFNTQIAAALADKLLTIGDRGAARAVARTVREGGFPVHALESELLLLRVDASEARFSAALRKAQSLWKVEQADVGWVRTQRFEVGWRALELARILGRTHEVADQLVTQFIDAEPPVLDGAAFLVPRRIPAICAAASDDVRSRCFGRVKALRRRLSGGITPETDELLHGAELYAAGKLDEAATAWRPLLRGSDVLGATMPDAMVEVFDHSGDAVLVRRIDEAEMARANEFNGATLAHVRASRRALDAGDTARARVLARQVVDAWSVADDDVPVLRKLREALGPAR